MKKHLWIFIMLLGWAGMAFAQGGRISYQAVVRDGGNELVRNTAVSVTVEVYDAADALAYREQHNATTNQNGLLSIFVGGGTPEAGSWENIPWSRAWFRVQASVGNLTLTDTEHENTEPGEWPGVWMTLSLWLPKGISSPSVR